MDNRIRKVSSVMKPYIEFVLKRDEIPYKMKRNLTAGCSKWISATAALPRYWKMLFVKSSGADTFPIFLCTLSVHS